MAGDDWYYTIDKQRHGPISAAQLGNLAAGGRLQPTDLVWKEGLTEWIPAARLKGLFVTPEFNPTEGPNLNARDVIDKYRDISQAHFLGHALGL